MVGRRLCTYLTESDRLKLWHLRMRNQINLCLVPQIHTEPLVVSILD